MDDENGKFFPLISDNIELQIKAAQLKRELARKSKLEQMAEVEDEPMEAATAGGADIWAAKAKAMASFTAPKDILDELAQDESQPVLEPRRSRKILDREDEYKVILIIYWLIFNLLNLIFN